MRHSEKDPGTGRLRCRARILLATICGLAGGLQPSPLSAAGRWIGVGPEGGLVNVIRRAPNNNAILYAGLDGGGVYRSNNSGITWFKRSSGLTHQRIVALAVDPQTPGTLYAGDAEVGVFKSVNSGASWTAVNAGLSTTPSVPVSAIAIDPVSGASLYAALTNLGIFRSTNGGVSWLPVNEGLEDQRVFAIAIDPVQSERIYLGTRTAVYRSSDGGDHWQGAAAGLPDGSVRDVAIRPDNPAVLYALISDKGIFRSGNRGDSWQARNSGLTDLAVSRLVLDPSDPKVMYVSTFAGRVFKTTDSGTNWAQVAEGFFNPLLGELLVDPGNPAKVQLASFGLGVFVSTDGGVNWSASNTGMEALSILSTTVSWEDPLVVFAASYGGGLLMSNDGGLSWAPSREGLNDAFTRIVTFDPHDSQTLYAIAESGFYRSNNGGETWEASTTGLTGSVGFALAADPVNPGVIFAGGNGGVFRSTNGGSTWTEINSGLGETRVRSLALDPSDSDVLYAGTLLGVYKSTNGGQNWDQAGTELASLSVTSLAIDAVTPSTLFAGFFGGVQKSTDGGSTWNSVGAGISDPNVRNVVIHPTNPQVVDVATGLGGVFRSQNGGASWAPFNTGLSHRGISSLARDPTNSSTLLAGSNGGSVFKYLENELHFAQFGDGGNQLTSRIVAHNLNEEFPATIRSYLRDDEGRFLSIKLSGAQVSGSLDQVVPSGGLQSFASSGEGEFVRGSVSVYSDRPIDGVILFGGMAGLAGVAGRPGEDRHFIAPMQSNAADLINTGLALQNLRSSANTVDLELYDSEGSMLASGQIELPAFGHTALFVTEIDWSNPVDFANFLGLLEGRGSGRLAAMAIQLRAQEFATMPVATPIDPGIAEVDPAPSRRQRSPMGELVHVLRFAQFGDGLGQIFSQILLFPLGDDNTHAKLLLKDDTGDPLQVDLNGAVVSGELDFDTPSRGLRQFRSDGLGPLTSGSVTVLSDRPLSGVTLFGGSAGVAGIGDSPELAGFSTAVLFEADLGTRTGVAVFNLSAGDARLDARLRDAQGGEISRAADDLAPMGHRAFFVDDLLWDAPVDFSDFKGLLQIDSNQAIAATAILTRPGQFATLPVSGR